jgi:hypothetical protein
LFFSHFLLVIAVAAALSLSLSLSLIYYLLVCERDLCHFLFPCSFLQLWIWFVVIEFCILKFWNLKKFCCCGLLVFFEKKFIIIIFCFWVGGEGEGGELGTWVV